jgi:hypothetical protein
MAVLPGLTGHLFSFKENRQLREPDDCPAPVTTKKQSGDLSRTKGQQIVLLNIALKNE